MALRETCVSKQSKNRSANPFFISLSGLAGSGKTTIADTLRRCFREDGYTVNDFSFASPIKDALCLWCGWDRQRLDSDPVYKEASTLDDGSPDPYCTALGMNRRVIMQRMGTECMRQGMHQDFWIILADLAVRLGKIPASDIYLIGDARFANELNWAKSIGAYCILISRAEIPLGSTVYHENVTLTTHTGHSSEQESVKWPYYDEQILNVVDLNQSEQQNRERLAIQLQILTIPAICKHFGFRDH